MAELLSAKHDIIFKKLFSEEKNKDLLTHFLSQVLKIPLEEIENVTVLNPGLPVNLLDEKLSVLDIKLELNNTVVDIEMQISQDKNFINRSLLYWAKMYSQILSSGESYDKLKKCISICVLDFPYLTDQPGYHFIHRIMEVEHHIPLTDHLEMHYLSLPKMAKEADMNDKEQLWLRLINAETKEELDMLAKNTKLPEIEKAVNIIQEMSNDRELREMIWVREKARHDEASRLSDADKRGEERGIKIGLEKGREETRNEIMNKMRKSGYTEEQIRDLFK